MTATVLKEGEIELAFHGAAGGVTGSCFLIETRQARVLIDCGLFQGPKSERELNYRPFPFDAHSIDSVILSHAHIDHSGLLPKLVKAGFTGTIHATPATVDLASVMLPDSGYVQESEVKHLNRRSARRGRASVEPIYTSSDAIACLQQFRAMPFGEDFSVAAGVIARFWNAGHLLGSASIEVALSRHGQPPLRILFSADIGPGAKLLQPDPEAPAGVDYVVCEATYGDVDRTDATEERRRRELRDEVRAAMSAGGALLIPSFAVERTQELLTDLCSLIAADELPHVPIYIDSPLASRATEVFRRHAASLDNGDALLAALASPDVRFTQTVEESIALDAIRDCHVVISASGMCEAGRIRYRLKNWLWRETATVLLVGFQAQGTLGRVLLDGARLVRIQGDEIAVRARIRSLDLYSGHADRQELIAWLRARTPIRHEVFLVHGEAGPLAGLKAALAEFLPRDRIVIPSLDAGYRLSDAGAVPLAFPAPPRVEAATVARRDWHNDLAQLVLDLGAAMDQAADDRRRGVIIRALRRALETASGE